MDHRLKNETPTDRNGRSQRRKAGWSWVWWQLLRCTPKAGSVQESKCHENEKLLKKKMSTDWEDKPQTGRKHVKRHLIKDCYRILQEALTLNSKRTKNSGTTWAKDLDRHLPKGDTQTASERVRRRGTSSLTGDWELKQQRDITTHLLEGPKSRTPPTPNAGATRSPREPRSLLVGMQHGAAALEDRLVVSYRTKHALTIRSSSHIPWYLLRGVDNLCPHKNLHVDVEAALLIIAQTWKPPRCPSGGKTGK